MADFQSQAGAFQIKVLEGAISREVLQDGQAAGVIQLVGRAGPLKGGKWGGKMRVVTKFYPGNPVGTQQAIGATEDPSTFTGEWNDRYLGEGQARILGEMIDRIRRAGVSVEVSWGGGIGGSTESPVLSGDPFVRVGMITSFSVTPDRVQDHTWEIEFTWRSRGQTSVNAIAATGKLNPREGVENLVGDLDQTTATMQAVLGGPQFSLGIPQPAADAIGRAFEGVDAAVETIQSASATVTSAVVIPTQAALQLIGACQTGLQAMVTMEATILGVNDTLLEVADSALGLLRLRDQALALLQQFTRTKETCIDTSDGMQQYVEPDIIREVRAPAGTDLRDLAIMFYGDPDLWWAIARENGIEGSAVPSPPAGVSDDPGRAIRIPRPTAGAASDLRQQC